MNFILKLDNRYTFFMGNLQSFYGEFWQIGIHFFELNFSSLLADKRPDIGGS